MQERLPVQTVTGASRHERNLSWVEQGTIRFEGAIARLSDEALFEDSLLPSWTRAHIATHVARNADGLGNLLRWARTGVETPMYESPELRLRDIDDGARRPPSAIRADLIASDDRLSKSIGEMTDDSWSSVVRTARGRQVVAAELPWVRAREVWIHCIDLDAGDRCELEIPPVLVDCLLDEVVEYFADAPGCPTLRLTITDREGGRLVGPEAGAGSAIEMSASALDAMLWLIGRGQKGISFSDRPDGETLPQLPAWM